MVSIKIDRVDKTSSLHPNIMLGKIAELDNDYAHVGTKLGKTRTLMSPTRLYGCAATNLQFDYTTELLFSSACKKANDSQKNLSQLKINCNNDIF